jgi:UDP:flavonoid glycosyltransferase YjiC (YdhE family)
LAETDVIINQLPGGLYGYDLAEKLNIPMLGAAVMPLTRTRTFPMLAFPAGFARFPGYNALSYHLAEQSVWQVFRPTINRWRTKTLGLPKQRFGGNFGQVGIQQYPILNGFSSHVVPRPLDWSEHVHITGYWFPRDEVWQPPDSLRKFIESGTPPVFIGFGSMPVRQPKQTTAVILEALKLSGQRAILHAGWAGIGDDDLPETVYKIDYAPYAWLFPQMAAVVHHGGSGTTAFGLRAGIPTLIIPFLFDQFYWGRRIATLGMGPKPVPFRKLSAARLGKALAIAATDRQMGQRAIALGQKIQQEEGVKKAVTIVEHYWRSSG